MWRRSIICVVVGLAWCATIVFGMVAPPVAGAAEGGGCPNEAVRVVQGSAFLPDCRAYELVSPLGVVPQFGEVEENNMALGGLAISNARAASDGERVSFASYYPAQESSQENGFFLAARTESGWTSESVIPPQSTSARTGCSANVLFSPELTAWVLNDDEYQNANPSCGHNEPSLITGEPAGWRNESELPFQNIFLREDSEGSLSYRLVNRTLVSTAPDDATLEAASQDLSHVVFSEAGVLYEWDDGTVRLVSVLPDGTRVGGSIPGGAGVVYMNGSAQYMHAVSEDGSRVVFVAEGELFVREHAEREQSTLVNGDECTEPEKACTVQVDASQAGGSGGGGTFFAANGDGSRVYFTDEATAKLTGDTVAGSKQNLYEYEVESKKLVDLTAVSSANVVGVSVIGEAEGSGSSYLYFVADGAFAAGATLGDPNLYVVHDGEAPVFVATLAASLDGSDWDPERLSVRTSPDGRFVVFDSARRQTTVNFPTGYENKDVRTGKPDEEIYLYSVEGQTLYCVSCQSSGAQPLAGGAELLIPSNEALIAEPGTAYLQRNVLDDGTVFFQTREALVAGDENEAADVYEYSGGEQRLLSTGTSPDSSLFVDASENGGDVFIATTQGLVARDTDGALSVYDVRVDGGFPPGEEEPVRSPVCEGEACRAPALEPPAVQGAASSVFSGPGNLQAPPLLAPATQTKRVLTRVQKLAGALRSCRMQRAKKRRRCEALARQRYRPPTKSATPKAKHDQKTKGGAR